MKNLTLLCLALLVPALSWAQTANSISNSLATSASGNVLNAPVMNFSSSAAPQTPIVSTPSLMQPQIFSALQRTPIGASVGVTAGYLKACRVKYTRSTQPEVRSIGGGSGHTTLVFAPNPTYLTLEREQESVQVEEVTPPTFSSDVVPDVVCLGTVTVFSQDGSTTGFETVVADLARFPFDNMKGIREVVIVAVPAGIASAGGVSSYSKTLGIGTGIAHVLSSVSTALLAPSFSGGNGESRPQEWLGGTFILLGVAENGKDVQPAEFAALFNSQPQNGAPETNGAKAEATK